MNFTHGRRSTTFPLKMGKRNRAQTVEIFFQTTCFLRMTQTVTQFHQKRHEHRTRTVTSYSEIQANLRTLSGIFEESWTGNRPLNFSCQFLGAVIVPHSLLVPP